MVDERKVPEGYKVTEVGVIPEDWELVPIGDIFKFKNGLNKAKQFFGEGTPIVNYMDVYKNRGICFKDIRGKVTLSSNELANYNVQKGDVFFTRTSETPDEIGITAVLLDEPQNTAFSGFILRARPVVDVLDIDYKRYCFSADVVRKEIISKCTYTTRALTNGRVLSKVNIFVPPKPEQKAIAEALSDTDNLIQSVEKLIDKKKKIKHGAMQQLLTGKKRLPGFSEQWEIKKLGDIVSINKGQLITEKDAQDGTIPVIAGGKKPAYYHSFPNRQGKTITISASGANAGYVGFYTEPIFASDCSTIGENNGYSIEFIYYQLSMLQENIYYAQTGGAQPHIHPKDLKPLLINYTNLKEQKAIAQVLSDMDAEIEALEEKLEKYKTIKQGMMQELLTGRIRLI